MKHSNSFSITGIISVVDEEYKAAILFVKGSVGKFCLRAD